jgi:hypothetical protein
MWPFLSRKIFESGRTKNKGLRAEAIMLEIGSYKDATPKHCVSIRLESPPTAPMEFPLTHATSVEKDEEYDR